MTDNWNNAPTSSAAEGATAAPRPAGLGGQPSASDPYGQPSAPLPEAEGRPLASTADSYAQPPSHEQLASQPSAAYGQPASRPSAPAADPYAPPPAPYGNPSSQPSAPYADVAPAQAAWGQPQQSWGQPGYDASPYALSPLSAANGYGGAAVPPLRPVDFGRRLKGWLIDGGIASAILLVGMIPFWIGYFMMMGQVINTRYDQRPDIAGAMTWLIVGGVITFIGVVVSWVITIWGRWIAGGTTGQSWGRKWAGTRLVDERTGQPIGIGMTVVRDLAHRLDSMALDIGYLAPLFTDKKQTFADMVMHTVVVDAEEVPLRNQPPAPGS